jgi:hypothetical protein
VHVPFGVPVLFELLDWIDSVCELLGLVKKVSSSTDGCCQTHNVRSDDDGKGPLATRSPAA